MRRVIALIAVAVVVALVVTAYQYDKKSDEKRIAEERAQLVSIADIEDPQQKIERYRQLLDTEPSAGTKARASRSLLLTMMRELEDAPLAIETGRGMLEGETESEVYVLGVKPRFRGFIVDEGKAVERLLERVQLSIEIPVEIMIVIVYGGYSFLRGTMGKAEGALIYERQAR